MKLLTNSDPPSLQEVEDRIDELRNIDLKTVDIDVIKELLVLLFRGYVNQTPKLKLGQPIYRGVLCYEKPDQVTQLSYPPKEVVKFLGRINRPGESIFYGCTSRQAIFYELGLKSGDKIAVSKWTMKSQPLLNNVGYTSESFNQLKSSRVVPSWSIMKEDFKTKVNEIVKEFFSQELTKRIEQGEEYLYKLSIAIAEKHFEDEIFAGLIYPSVAMHAEVDNMAIKPQYVDKYMCIEKVQYIQVNKHEKEFEYNITVLDSAESFGRDGEIEWKGPPQKWILDKTGDFLIFRVENGTWVARNETGDIVEPS